MNLSSARRRLRNRLDDHFRSQEIPISNLDPVCELNSVDQSRAFTGLASDLGLGAIPDHATLLAPITIASPKAPVSTAQDPESRVRKAWSDLSRSLGVPESWLSMNGRLQVVIGKRGSTWPTSAHPYGVLNISLRRPLVEEYLEMLDYMTTLLNGDNILLSGGSSTRTATDRQLLQRDDIAGTIEKIFNAVLFDTLGGPSEFLYQLRKLPRSYQERQGVLCRIMTVFAWRRMEQLGFGDSLVASGILRDYYPSTGIVDRATPFIRKYIQQAFEILRKPAPEPGLGDDLFLLDQAPVGSTATPRAERSSNRSRPAKEDNQPGIDPAEPVDNPPAGAVLIDDDESAGGYVSTDKLLCDLLPSLGLADDPKLHRPSLELKTDDRFTSIEQSGYLTASYPIYLDSVRDGNLYVAISPSGICYVEELTSFRGEDSYDEEDLREIVEQLHQAHPDIRSMEYKGSSALADGKPEGVKTLDEVAEQTVPLLPLSRRYKQFFGNLPHHFAILMYGPAGGGKSSFTFPLAQEFSRFGPSLVVLAEESIESGNVTLRSKRMRVRSKQIHFIETDQLQEIKRLLDTGVYQFCFIDSLNNIESTDPRGLIRQLVKDYPKVSFIFIAQVTKEGVYKGAGNWKHDVDIAIQVDKGTALIGEKNRYGKVPTTFEIFRGVRR